MSRNYDWTWIVSDITPPEAEAANAALDEYLDRDATYDYYNSEEKTLTGMSSRSLGGGESPEERAETVFKAIRDNIDRTVPVEITVIYVEQAPTETFSFGDDFIKPRQS